MTKITFYVLQYGHLPERDAFVCRLLEALQGGGANNHASPTDSQIFNQMTTDKCHIATIVVDDHATAEQLDEMLWAQSDKAFIPHDVISKQVESGQIECSKVQSGEVLSGQVLSQVEVNKSHEPQSESLALVLGEPNPFKANASHLIVYDDEVLADVSMQQHDVMVNLRSDTSDGIPIYFSRYERVVEIVANDPAHIENGRERYKYYYERGYRLETHKIDSLQAILSM